MRIVPKEFRILGHKITVDLDESLEEEDGNWEYSKNHVALSPISDDLTPSQQMRVFWHETVHAILDMFSYDELSEDEKFVDNMAQGIYQVLMTKRGNVNGCQTKQTKQKATLRRSDKNSKGRSEIS